MAYSISARAEILSNKTNVEQQFILEIDGIDLIFGAISVSKTAKYGDPIEYGDPGLVYGGTFPNPDGRAWISLGGTTRSITQKLDQERGGTGSITSLNVELVDIKQQLTALFQPGNVVDDILGLKARFYISFKDGAHPEDSALIFNGVIQKVKFGAGSVTVQIGNPEQLKRQTLFTEAKAELTSNINNSQTTITVDSTGGFLLPGDALTTYIRINDEIIQYTGISGNTFTGCVRGQLNTIADSHDADDSVESFYRLQGETIELALKLMLSNDGNTSYLDNLTIVAFVKNGIEVVANAIFFEGINVNTRYGVAIGDTMVVSGATNAGNNGTFTVLDIQNSITGSYIVVNGALVQEQFTSAVASFTSQYNTLPDGAGLGMTPDLVDVQGHQDLENQFGSSFLELDLYIKEEINGKELISQQIYYPSGLYQIPRKGRSGVGYTSPPLVTFDTKILNNTNVTKAERLEIERSIVEAFYNAVVFKFNIDSLEDDFLSSYIFQSARSTNRIPVGNRPLVIEAPGARPSLTQTINQLEAQGRRFIDRYQFGAEKITINTTYENFNAEVGDVVIFEGETLQISDNKSGTRDFAPRLMEITNSKLNLVTGDLQFELTDTAFGLDGRYAVISPSSIVGVGSTTTRVVIVNSFGSAFGVERAKWFDYVGQELLIHNEDWSFQESSTLVQVDVAAGNVLVFDDPFSIPIPEGYVIETNTYPTDPNPKIQRFLKAIHCHWNPQVEIVSSSSNFTFEVAASDIDKFFIGSFVRVHNDDFSIQSIASRTDDDAVVTNINNVTNIITVDRDLGFTPLAGYKVDLIGFPDQGLPYRYL
jgi:hypothetical protein